MDQWSNYRIFTIKFVYIHTMLNMVQAQGSRVWLVLKSKRMWILTGQSKVRWIYPWGQSFRKDPIFRPYSKETMCSRRSCWMWPRSTIRAHNHKSEFTLSSLWLSFIKCSRGICIWWWRRGRHWRCVDDSLWRRLLAKRQYSYDKTCRYWCLLGSFRSYLRPAN